MVLWLIAHARCAKLPDDRQLLIIYLSLDGSATVYVNSSVPALDALRGASLDTSPTARLDRDAVRRFYTTPVTRVVQVSQSRRSGRRRSSNWSRCSSAYC